MIKVRLEVICYVVFEGDERAEAVNQEWQRTPAPIVFALHQFDRSVVRVQALDSEDITLRKRRGLPEASGAVIHAYDARTRHSP